MKKLLTLAAVVAVAAPALLATSAQAASLNAPSVNSGPSAAPVLKLIQRCKLKRINVWAERMALYANGHRKIKYLGTSVFHKRCAQFVRFSTCQGNIRYKATIRYIKGANRYTILQRNGFCLGYRPNPRLKQKTN